MSDDVRTTQYSALHDRYLFYNDLILKVTFRSWAIPAALVVLGLTKDSPWKAAELLMAPWSLAVIGPLLYGHWYSTRLLHRIVHLCMAMDAIDRLWETPPAVRTLIQNRSRVIWMFAVSSSCGIGLFVGGPCVAAWGQQPAVWLGGAIGALLITLRFVARSLKLLGTPAGVPPPRDAFPTSKSPLVSPNG